MKYSATLILTTLLLMVSSVCTSEESTTEVVKNPFSIQPFALPKTNNALFKDYRTSWNRLTGFEYSGLHWKQFVAIFVNQGEDIYRKNYLAYLSLYRDEDEDEDDEEYGYEEDVDSFQEYEVGTIFLKENYLSNEGKPGAPSTLTVMIKREPGFDPDGGNWEYLQTDIEGNVIMQGDSNNPQIKKVCSECHANMAERDYVFSTFLTAKTPQ